MIRVPNHPHAFYEAAYDQWGRYWIRCHCQRCGDFMERQCSQPARTNYWVLWFARQHGHGVVPRLMAR